MKLFRRALFQQLQAIAAGVFRDVEVLVLGATPSGELPRRYLTWTRVSTIHERHLTGGSGLVRSRFDVNAWARQLADAEDLADAIREQLDNLRGTIGVDQTADVQGIFLDTQEHEFVSAGDGSAGGYHRVRSDMIFVHPETKSPI
jgi:hypothetical protein